MELLTRQREYFASGQTKSLQFRLNQLRRLEEAIKAHETAILSALHEDLGKPSFEAFLSEVWFTLEELRFFKKKLAGWVRPKKVPTPWLFLGGRSQVIYEPKGSALIIGPWNYPFQLVMAPLVAAIGAGNCAVVKPSEMAPATSKIIYKIISSIFDGAYVTCVEGGISEAEALLAQKFDHIFFTGGGEIGKIVMEKASRNLVPVTLELGGKSPVIVDRDVDISVAVQKIAWGKFFNAGQTCVAPDYVLVPEEIQNTFVDALKKAISAMYGPDPETSPDYARVINDRHFQRLTQLLRDGHVAFGGNGNRDSRYFAPTIITQPNLDAPLMTAEIFGPILPIVTYRNWEDIFGLVGKHPKPLALYLFSLSKEKQDEVARRISFGGGCVNETLVHLNNPHLPFGGVGPSGMGAYHGRFGFEEFSHRKAWFTKKGMNHRLMFPPYGTRLGWIKKWL